MPDGSVIAKQENDIPTPAELHQHLVDLARQALERALEELPEGESDVGRLRRAFGEHARERLAQTPIAIWFAVIRDEGRNEGLAAAAAGLRAAAGALAQVRRVAPMTRPRLASERFPKEQLFAYANGAADLFARAVSNANIAVLGKVLRGELPTLDARTRAVYAAEGIGRAAGALAAGLLRAEGGDVFLARALREALQHGMALELGPALELATGKAN